MTPIFFIVILNYHEISGVGFPPATHFIATGFPGCKISSENDCRIIGGSTVKQRIWLLILETTSNKQQLTSASKFEFSCCLSTLLIVFDDALIHSFVLFLHSFNAKHSFGVIDKFTVFHPSHSFDRISREMAREYGRSTEIDGLSSRFDGCRQWCSDSEN